VSDLDDLAEAARNRGLKLVRSRVRTPGKPRFGKAGLTDPAGKPVFGMDAKGPTATPEEVETYLRSLGASDWGASLGSSARPVKRKTKTRVEHPAPPKPKPKPKPQVRDAKPGDSKRLVGLVRLLDHTIDATDLRKNLNALAKEKLSPLVATLDKEVVGLCGIHRMVTVHRSKRVGRITILVVADQARHQGIGRMLTKCAEERLRKLGCGMVEVTSNDRLGEAHAFYRHMGYERTSIRFAKIL
jgi:N-acetylglutamate synthase-like GNAT family acetyltransferase